MSEVVNAQTRPHTDRAAHALTDTQTHTLTDELIYLLALALSITLESDKT